MNLHTDKVAFLDAIRATSNAMNIKPHFVEKDYWLCLCLHKLVRLDAGQHAVFKGGTSLTKAYDIGSRFSEDLDIAIADAHLMTGNQLKTTIRRIAHGMTEGLEEVVKEGTSKGSHYHKAFYKYPTITNVPTSSSVRAGEMLLEISSFANPYPWQLRTIRSFIAEHLHQSGNDELINKYDLADFEIPVLDYRRTLTEKLVSLMRCSLADKYMEQMNAKIRHFYDLHYLMQDEDCRAYIRSDEFLADFLALLEHDRQSFAKPDGWRERPLDASPLVIDLHGTWKRLQLTYLRELPDLAYRDVPPVEQVEASMNLIVSAITRTSIA